MKEFLYNDDTMTELVFPRNEKEMCELFEDLLFMRTEKFSDFPKSEGDEKYKITEQGLALLAKRGVINRIFRRWFQTTWGWRNWTDHFEGETPRQELNAWYPDFSEGRMMLSVEMVRKEGDWKIEPRLFKVADLKEGPVVFGIQETQKQKNGKILTPPSYDPGFRAFGKYLHTVEEYAKKVKSYSPPLSREETYWKLFVFQVGPQLVARMPLNLPQKSRMKLSVIFHEYLDSCFLSQSSKLDDFLSIDTIISDLWNILRAHDKKLLDYGTMNPEDEEDIAQHLHERGYLYSTRAFYLLGHLFDELILFPLDRYFNSVEIVWTSKENFLGSFATTIELLNNNLKLPKMEYHDKTEKKAAEFMNLDDTALVLERLWFAPPTCFRLLPVTQQYL